MKIAINTFGCEHGRSGIGSYLISLVKNLPNNTSHSFELFGSELDRYTYTSERVATTFSGLSIPDSLAAERFWHFFKLKGFAKKNKYDAILYPSGIHSLPLLHFIPGIAVVQEIISETLKRTDSFIERKILLYKLKKVTKIIAASQCIRKDLVNLGVDSTKIEVIHNGLDHSHFYQHTELEGDTVTIKPFSIKRPYFIYASRIHHPSKRHVELIQAFSIFKENTKLPHRLVLAGSDGFNAKIVHEEASKSQFASDIFLTGYFPHENLPELYSCADACVFPSATEGVGLPIIEAMATGIPVLCAKAGSLTEIAGDNAVYFNPENPADIASSLELIVKDQKLKEKLIKSGFEWVKRFSWDKTAEKTIELIEEIVNNKA